MALLSPACLFLYFHPSSECQGYVLKLVEIRQLWMTSETEDPINKEHLKEENDLKIQKQ